MTAAHSVLQPAIGDADDRIEVSSSIGGLVLTYVSQRRRMGELTGESPANIRKTLINFASFVGMDLDVRRVQRRHVERWLSDRPLALTTQHMRLSTVRVFFGWLVEHGYCKKNPTDGIKGPRVPRQVTPRAVSRQEVALVFAACPDCRAEVIVSLMVQEGLRALEVAGLQVGDIDWQRRSMLVRGKGGHERVLWITEESWRLLHRYIAAYPAPAGPLIRSFTNPHRPLSKKYLARCVGEWMRDAGVAESGHALRHTAASDMLEHGAHVRTVQYVLGHASLATTERYLRWLVGQLEDAMGGRTYRHPDDPPA